MLPTSGSVDQFHACGLKTVKQQMKMKKLLLPANVNPGSTSTCTSSVSDKSPCCSGKLSKIELSGLSPEDKRVYLMM